MENARKYIPAASGGLDVVSVVQDARTVADCRRQMRSNFVQIVHVTTIHSLSI